MKRSILFMTVISFILSGCANSLLRTIDKSNERFEKNQSPYRYVKIEEKGTHTTFQLEPAGIPQQTVAASSKLLLLDILKGLKQKCGFEKDDIVEIRKVSYEQPQYYEVWVFKDELSKRADKTSALSVVLDVYPDNGGVDIYFSGECHSVPRRFTFTN
jgi:hypothetical protein